MPGHAYIHWEGGNPPCEDGHEPYRPTSPSGTEATRIWGCRRCGAGGIDVEIPGCREVGVRRVRSNGHYPKTRPSGGIGNDGHAGQGGLDERYTAGEESVAYECAEGCPVAMLDAQAGERKGGGNINGRPTRFMAGSREIGPRTFGGYDDTGGASRFFYCSKSSSRERTAGLRPGERNLNPCVKPLALCEWLLKLAVPPGGAVLDPFAGSGSLGCAAARLGIGYVGIEQDAAMADQAERRIAHHAGPIFAALAAD